MYELNNCPDCGTKPGYAHLAGCSIERCSACGGLRVECKCKDHDPAFSRWNGFVPGELEAQALGITVDELSADGGLRIFFIKPAPESAPHYKKYRHRSDGWWRAAEVREHVEQRTGIHLNKNKWDYLLKKGVIPAGDGRNETRNHGAGFTQLWSDMQIEEIIVNLRNHFGRG